MDRLPGRKQEEAPKSEGLSLHQGCLGDLELIGESSRASRKWQWQGQEIPSSSLLRDARYHHLLQHRWIDGWHWTWQSSHRRRSNGWKARVGSVLLSSFFRYLRAGLNYLANDPIPSISSWILFTWFIINNWKFQPIPCLHLWSAFCCQLIFSTSDRVSSAPCMSPCLKPRELSSASIW